MGLPECPHGEVAVEPATNDGRTPESRAKAVTGRDAMHRVSTTAVIGRDVAHNASTTAVIARYEAIADTTNLMAVWAIASCLAMTALIVWATASCLAVTAVVIDFFVIFVTFVDKEVVFCPLSAF
jgi:hypothetical protein